MIVRNRMVVGRSGAVVGLGLAISLGLINAAAAQGPTELNLGPGYRLPLMPPSPTPAILPATQYLVGQLRAGMTLEMYLRRLRGEFQLADADADGEVSESDAAVHAQFEVANYRSRLLLEIMSNDLNGDGVVTGRNTSYSAIPAALCRGPSRHARGGYYRKRSTLADGRGYES
jgi:hypothetical protein